MKIHKLIAPIVVILLGVSVVARAEISIEQLVEQAQLSEGSVAVRDLPRWKGAKKIVIRDIGVDPDALADVLGDVEFVVVRSSSEALPHAGDADAITGFCDDELIDAAARLVWVQITSAGAEGCLSHDRIGSGGRADQYAEDVLSGDCRACRRHDDVAGAASAAICECDG